MEINNLNQEKPRKIHSVAGLFSTPDEIIKAAKEVYLSKFKSQFDVNTPYPIHGMDSAMKLK